MKSSRFQLLVLLGAVASGAASATVVYDTLGPTNSWITGSWIVGNFDGSTPTAYNYITAQSFVPTSSGYLTSITAPVVLLPFSIALPIQLEIRADNAGTPGAVIASALIPLSSSSQPTLYTATFAGTFLLTTSSSYWFGMSATYAGTAASWQKNALGVSSLHAFTGTPFLQPGQWQLGNDIAGAARINVTSAVPEPSQALLLLLGAPLLLAAVAKRRQVA